MERISPGYTDGGDPGDVKRNLFQAGQRGNVHGSTGFFHQRQYFLQFGEAGHGTLAGYGDGGGVVCKNHSISGGHTGADGCAEGTDETVACSGGIYGSGGDAAAVEEMLAIGKDCTLRTHGDQDIADIAVQKILSGCLGVIKGVDGNTGQISCLMLIGRQIGDVGQEFLRKGRGTRLSYSFFPRARAMRIFA